MGPSTIPEYKTKHRRPTVSPSTSPTLQHSKPSTSTRDVNRDNHQDNRGNHRDVNRDSNRDNNRGVNHNNRETKRETNQATSIPVQQPRQGAKVTPTPPFTQVKDEPKSTYQNPGPGFDQTVANVPGVGLVYNNQPNQSFNGFNPAAAIQQPQQHQIPGANHPQPPQAFPPGFPQVPQAPTPPVGQTQANMAYNMPNQGQHFQPPVPDTTYGPIPHTYHPRFDADAGDNHQYVSIGGQIYQVQQQVQGSAGTQVCYVPVQQVSAFNQSPQTALPVYVAQEANPQQPILYMGTTGNATAQQPILMQMQPGQQAQQQPVYVQAGPANQNAPFLVQAPGGQQQQAYYVQVPGQGAHPVQMMAQPGAHPAMMAQTQAGGFPDVMGIGKTGTEIQIEQYHTALNTKALEGQDMAPGDPDPSRMYYCRELDGEWTLRNRYGIDNLGDCRWYVMPGGVFYAVRLAD